MYYKLQATYHNGGRTRFWTRGSPAWHTKEERAAFLSLTEVISLVASWADCADIRELLIVRVDDTDVIEAMQEDRQWLLSS